MIALELFGGLTVRDDGGALSGRAAQRKRLALLAALGAALPRAVSRDKLVALLWPESDSERARHLLASSVYELRRAFGEDALLVSGDTLQLNPERTRCDVPAFRQALERGDRATAVALYTGPFLDGFFLSDAPEFERWVDGEREGLARTYAAALEALAEEQERAGNFASAVDWWRRLATHDPLSSRIALRLMQALEQAGDPGGAIQHGRVHELVLRSELEAELPAELRSLAERLRRIGGAASKASASEPDPLPEPVHAPPAAGAIDSREGMAAGQRAADGLIVAGSPELQAGSEVAPPARPPAASSGGSRQRLIPRWARDRRAAGPVLLAAALLVALVLGYVASERQVSAGEASARIGSLAVLPLENFSGSPDNDYFVEGMTDALITELARLGTFRVISRTSVMRYQGTKASLPDIARELGVDAIVEGSVSLEGERVRIVAQLLRGATDEHLWARTYERDLTGVLALQAEIAGEIASEIGAELTPAEHGTPSRNRRIDAEAYGAYLKGVYFAGQGDLPSSIGALRQSIGLDGDFAPAYTTLARNYFSLAFFGVLPPGDAFGLVKQAATRALELDETNSEAHGLLALVGLHQEWDWADAERHFRRALELNPNNAQVRHDYSHYLLAMGRFEESLAESRQAASIDPFYPGLIACLGWHHLSDGQYAAGREQALKAVTMAPDFFWPYLTLGWTYEQQREYPEAIAALRRSAELSGGMPFTTAALAHGLAGGGSRQEAEEIAAALERGSGDVYVSAYELAAVFAGLGDDDEAFRWLQRAYAERSTALVHLKWEPRFARLRPDPRFAALTTRIGLP